MEPSLANLRKSGRNSRPHFLQPSVPHRSRSQRYAVGTVGHQNSSAFFAGSERLRVGEDYFEFLFFDIYLGFCICE